MSQIDDKVRGNANEGVGNAKQVIGHVTGDEQLQAEGKGQEVKGEAQQALGNAKEAIGNLLENAGNALKGSGK